MARKTARKPARRARNATTAVARKLATAAEAAVARMAAREAAAVRQAAPAPRLLKLTPAQLAEIRATVPRDSAGRVAGHAPLCGALHLYSTHDCPCVKVPRRRPS